MFFLDQFGKAIAVGSGQGDRDKHVLMMGENKLVYYLVQVNDVYAYFLTGTKHRMITPPPTRFPTTQLELNAVKTYAKKSFLDENVLVVELKSSWIELPPGRGNTDYVSITAQVPDFDMSSDTKWTQIGMRPATLAMVGMHIAFSVRGGPELVWATFEHVNNAPNVRYQYWDRNDFRSFGPWLFSSGGGEGANQARMVMKGNDIVEIDGKKIGPSDVLRLNPWGTQQAEILLNFNTPVISTNNNVQGRLKRGDVRKNYMFIGATWGGMAKKGSRNLANSTMETFVQSATCPECHRFETDMLGTKDEHGNPAGLSHIFGVLNGLFPDP
jgi:hypothetical protein